MSRFDSLEGWQGWQRTQGWNNHQGWHGGAPDADPSSGVLVEGLLRNREALLIGRPTPGSGGPSAPVNSNVSMPAPPLDAPKDLLRCADEVRLKVLVFELLEPITILAVAATKGTPAAARVTVGTADLARIEQPQLAAFGAQVPLVEDWAKRRGERAAEILSQMGPQMAYWSAALSLSGDRTPRTFELCDTAMVFASFVVQRVKQIINVPRPSTFSTSLQPMIPNPGHTTFPSGHATEAFMMARLLQRLLKFKEGGDDDKLLQAQAERIAMNRVVAGLHFPIDNIAGRALGESLADYFLCRCGASKTFTSRGTQQMTGQEKFDYKQSLPGQTSAYREPCSDNLGALWTLARAEHPPAVRSSTASGRAGKQAAKANGGTQGGSHNGVAYPR